MALLVISVVIAIWSIRLITLILKDSKYAEDRAEILLGISDINGCLSKEYREKYLSVRDNLAEVYLEKNKLSIKLTDLERKYKILSGLNDHNEFLLSKWMTPKDDKTGKFTKK